VKIEHAAAPIAALAVLPGGLRVQSRYPAKIKPGMICVLAYQVKVKNAGNCCKSVEKSTENDRNLRPVKITIRRPDDWHLHVRDAVALQTVVPHTAHRFGRAIIMPNLNPPVTSTVDALAYRERILAAVPSGSEFEPLMTLYLTDNTSSAEIHKAQDSGFIHAVKYYPAGATTNSDSGVTAIENVFPVLETLQEIGMPLLVHGEVTDPDVDVFDREAVFIDRVLAPLVKRLPDLKLVLEHVSTRQGIEFVMNGSDHIAGTLTAHHLLMNRNAIFAGGIRPHNYCLPVLKREQHRLALLEAATSGNPKFFLGTDSAPHSQAAKETSCGCAGLYTAHAAIELYAEAFDQAGALDRLEGFASCHGADFYGLPRNESSITLSKTTWEVPGSYPLGKEKLIPMRSGETVGWTIE
jgi:dihydroorotase